MNHADIKKHLAAYLEGELPIDDRALVDAHLDACDLCAGEVEEMLQTIRLLRTLPEPEIPPMITANVMRRIRSGESQLGFFGRIARVFGAVFEPAFVLPASAIAAAALVVTVVQGLGVVPTTPTNPIMADAARDSRNQGRSSIGRTESSVASLPSSIAATRRGGFIYLLYRRPSRLTGSRDGSGATVSPTSRSGRPELRASSLFTRTAGCSRLTAEPSTRRPASSAI